MNIIILPMYSIQWIVQLDILVTSNHTHNMQSQSTATTELSSKAMICSRQCTHITNAKYKDRLSGWMIIINTAIIIIITMTIITNCWRNYTPAETTQHEHSYSYYVWYSVHYIAWYTSQIERDGWMDRRTARSLDTESKKSFSTSLLSPSQS